MRRAAPFRHPDPLGEMNVTPFIDVMLVLLIMMILTIPLQTHKLPIDLPVGGKAEKSDPRRLFIDRQGAVFWDARRIGDAELNTLLVAAAGEDGELHVRTDPDARYERFNGVLAMVRRAGITRLGLVGNRPFEDMGSD